MITINNSVGSRGVNQQADVLAIQKLLNCNRHLLIPLPAVPEDGVLNEATQKAINTFQKRVVRFENPDGRVDPGGQTLKKLNENARSTSVNVQPKLLFPFKTRPAESYKVDPRRFHSPRPEGRKHAGCDLYKPPGTQILAMADGVVIQDAYDFYDGTKALEIDHGSFIIRYGEIEKPAPGIKKGVHVQKGQVIAYVGKLVSLNMSMLHLEMYSGVKGSPLQSPLTTNGNPFKRRDDLLDPTDYLDCTDCTEGEQLTMNWFDNLVLTYKATDLGQLFQSLGVSNVPEENYYALKIATVAQWWLESGQGTSLLSQKYLNFGGLKWRPEMQGYATQVPYEAHDGLDQYCKFASLDEFIRGYWRFIQRSPYKGWQNSCHSPEDYISFLKARNYAQDPNYVAKVLSLVPKACQCLEASLGESLNQDLQTLGTWIKETDAAIYWMQGNKYIKKLDKIPDGSDFKVIVAHLQDWFTDSQYPAPGTMKIAKGDVPEPDGPIDPSDQKEEVTLKIRFDPAHSKNFKQGRNGATIDRIVLHNTAGSFAGAVSWFKNPTARVSAHYVISRQGKIVQMVKDQDTAYHTGSGNSRSIGIEHEADDNHRGLTPEMENATIALIKSLMNKYNIGVGGVVPHRTDWGGLPGNNTPCPNLLRSSQAVFDSWKNKKFN